MPHAVFKAVNMNATHVNMCLLIQKLCNQNQINYYLTWLFQPVFTFDAVIQVTDSKKKKKTKQLNFSSVAEDMQY